MKAHRMLLRFDYIAQYEIIDALGAIMRSLDEIADDFWNELGMSSREPKISAEREIKLDDGGNLSRLLCKLVVDPKVVILDFEYLNPVAITALSQEEAFSKILKWLDSFFDSYNIKKVERAGLRIYAFDKVKDFDSVKRFFLSRCLAEGAVTGLGFNLNEINDVGLNFDSNHEDGSLSHCHIGPCDYSGGEYRKYMRSLSVSLDEALACEKIKQDFDLVIDLDVYENKFILPSTVKRWTQMRIDSITKIVTQAKSSVLIGVGDGD